MAVGSFAKVLSGFTSDHTYQIAQVETETPDNKEISLVGMTWDLMNKGHSSIELGFSNNPFDLDETDKAYAIRKKKQLKFLSKLLRKGELDFVFLQEVDIFTGTPMSPIARDFLSSIRSLGWRVVHNDKTDDLTMPLLILYNSNKLKFIHKRPLFKSKTEKFTSLEGEFFHIDSGAKLCLVNINLDSAIDYNQEIKVYQQEQMANQKMTVIGGDTHAANGVEYHCVVGDVNVATSVNVLKDADAEEQFEGAEVLGEGDE